MGVLFGAGLCGFSGRRTDESTPEETLLLTDRLVGLLPPDCRAGLRGKAGGAELEPVQRC